jgi:DNA-binding NarL/FixJ family response regulator
MAFPASEGLVAMGTSSEKPCDRKINVLIVDDHTMVREGLTGFLLRQPDLEVCGEAEDAVEAMRQVIDKRPDLAIIDISLRSGNGLELVKRIHSEHERVKILVLSMHDESLFAERAIRAGAMGYLNKQQPRQKIIEAIRCILEGRVYLSPDMTERVLSRTLGRSQDQSRSPIESLSDRELEVFELIGHGQTVREIARKLELSPKTVETYRENIKVKLDIDNATELVRHATQWVMEQA